MSTKLGKVEKHQRKQQRKLQKKAQQRRVQKRKVVNGKI
jgi:hypothetical protein